MLWPWTEKNSIFLSIAIKFSLGFWFSKTSVQSNITQLLTLYKQSSVAEKELRFFFFFGFIKEKKKSKSEYPDHFLFTVKIQSRCHPPQIFNQIPTHPNIAPHFYINIHTLIQICQH